jgi:uncharacterized protein
VTPNPTFVSSFVGGALIGLSASALLLLTGRVAGISGIASRLLSEKGEERNWRLAFLMGLLLGGVLLAVFRPSVFDSPDTVNMNWIMIGLAAIAVGVGTTIGNGCTSGHGVCGVSRFSKRSIVATMVFMGVAMVVTFVVRHALKIGVGGG